MDCIFQKLSNNRKKCHLAWKQNLLFCTFSEKIDLNHKDKKLAYFPFSNIYKNIKFKIVKFKKIFFTKTAHAVNAKINKAGS